MKTKYFNRLIAVLFSISIMASCSKEEFNVAPQINNEAALKLANATLTENFENGTKTAYAAADVTFASGIWNLNDALLGTSTSDKKNGTKSVRIQNVGKLTMKFDKTNGAGTVEIKHAKYGTDATSTWELYVSSNSGTSWTKVGNTITSSSSTLVTQLFNVNLAGNVRFEIRKLTGTRLNIDDFSVSS